MPLIHVGQTTVYLEAKGHGFQYWYLDDRSNGVTTKFTHKGWEVVDRPPSDNLILHKVFLLSIVSSDSGVVANDGKENKAVTDPGEAVVFAVLYSSQNNPNNYFGAPIFSQVGQVGSKHYRQQIFLFSNQETLDNVFSSLTN